MRSREAFFQRVASSLIVPLTFLPLAAILLAIGSQLGIGPVESAGLTLIRTWLPLFYGIGISIGFTEADGMGALTVASGYLVMVSVAEAVAGDPTLNVGVLGGIIAGAVMTWIFNKVKHVSLPEYLALFSGKRMGPMVAALAGVVLGYLFGIFWPPIHQGIVTLGEWIYSAGGVGAFVYGGVLRLLIPTGLHHILMQLVDTQLGGWVDPTTGKLVAGEYVRFLHGDPSAGRILSGFFLTLGFGPLGAALAITKEAKPAQRAKVAGLMTTGALTAMLLGVTEPVEFAFIFASPLLFGLHVVLSGFASLLGYIMEIHLGGYALPMILINWHRQQNGLLIFPLGLAWTLLYYLSFRAVIRWLRPPILGQTDDPAPDLEGVEALPGEAPEASPEGERILAALGGAANIAGLTACMTRLRVEVRDPAAVDEPALRRLGASGVVRAGSNIQVVVGVRAGELARSVEAAMEAGSARVATQTPAAAAQTQVIAAAVTLVSPVTGRVVPLEQVDDPVFAGGMAGRGVAIEPAADDLVSPVRGQVLTVFPGGHAIGLVTPEGLEILLHVGIDTVGLNGQGFEITVRSGDQVEPGTPLGRFDRQVIVASGRSAVTPLLVTNADQTKAITVLTKGNVRAGEPLLLVELEG
ncbi:MAG: glucose PTS transporter subunit IIA [Bacillota bacterium]